MGTEYKNASLNDYVFHKKTDSSIDGYHYYLYIHPQGQVIVARENSTETEYKFANGDNNASDAWTNKTTLSYVDYDKLAK